MPFFGVVARPSAAAALSFAGMGRPKVGPSTARAARALQWLVAAQEAVRQLERRQHQGRHRLTRSGDDAASQQSDRRNARHDRFNGRQSMGDRNASSGFTKPSADN